MTTTATVPTAREARQTYEVMGLTGVALDALVQAGAAARHEARVLATIAAATARGEEIIPGRGREVALLLLVADACGTGGPGGHAGDATCRAEWACGLGKGRKQEEDIS